MFSLSGQALAAASASNSVEVDASVAVRCPYSIQRAAPPSKTMIIARTNFKSTSAFVAVPTSLRMEPPLPEIINQIRDRQDRQQPHQDQRNLSGRAFWEQSGEEAYDSPDEKSHRGPAVPGHVRSFAASGRLPPKGDAVCRRVVGEQRPVHLEADHVNHRADNCERDGEGLELGR